MRSVACGIEERLPASIQIGRREVAPTRSSGDCVEQILSGSGTLFSKRDLPLELEHANALKPSLACRVPLRPGHVEADLPLLRRSGLASHGSRAKGVQIEPNLRAISIILVGP